MTTSMPMATAPVPMIKAARDLVQIAAEDDHGDLVLRLILAQGLNLGLEFRQLLFKRGFHNNPLVG